MGRWFSETFIAVKLSRTPNDEPESYDELSLRLSAFQSRATGTAGFGEIDRGPADFDGVLLTMYSIHET
jgi:hypothetical protein